MWPHPNQEESQWDILFYELEYTDWILGSGLNKFLSPIEETTTSMLNFGEISPWLEHENIQILLNITKIKYY